jgi:hypothetical protein
MCLRVSYKKNMKFCFASSNSLEKGVGPRSIIQRYGSEDLDPEPDPQQNVTDPHHCFYQCGSFNYIFFFRATCWTGGSGAASVRPPSTWRRTCCSTWPVTSPAQSSPVLTAAEHSPGSQWPGSGSTCFLASLIRIH